MTNTKDNQEENKMRRSRVWGNEIMNGTWDGNVVWYNNKQWTGQGKWRGGFLMGSWDVKGNWMTAGNGVGECKGGGIIDCNMGFMKHMEKTIAIIGVTLSVATAALSLIVNLFGLITAIIIIAVIGLLSIASISLVQKTKKGKLCVEGTWKDVGKFRVLDVTGNWALGPHTGKIEGRMKDPKPIADETLK